MKTSDLPRYVEPEKPLCASCKTYTPDCLVPDGDGAIPMCWYCAHHVVEHERPVRLAYKCECECSLQEILPADVIERREQSVRDYKKLRGLPS